ncbi:unnamed protein product [Brassica rapa]|uniref:Serine/threonine-protein kinase BSK n=1 Tax=Brassica campestris TaxID=3711 RepID=A0A3P6AB34_BRACM|nr:unnamed protein product [Brassica rapa]VDC84543.1 unnamed protein product [Brassica rapa]
MKSSHEGKNHSTKLEFAPPEYLHLGILIRKSVTYSFGTLLLDLMSGRHIPPNHVNKNSILVFAFWTDFYYIYINVLMLMDSALDGQFFDEDRRELMHIASRCLKTEPQERPKPLKLTPFGDACLRADLCTIHELLEKLGYGEEDGVSHEHGDAAFRAKDFDTAIELFTEAQSEAMQAQVASPEWPISLYLQAVCLFKLEI